MDQYACTSRSEKPPLNVSFRREFNEIGQFCKMASSAYGICGTFDYFKSLFGIHMCSFLFHYLNSSLNILFEISVYTHVHLCVMDMQINNFDSILHLAVIFLENFYLFCFILDCNALSRFLHKFSLLCFVPVHNTSLWFSSSLYFVLPHFGW